jgi:hypothetical protein
MIELTCPSCGRAGSIPKDRVNTRLTCKNCRKVFHVNAAGRALLGEPRVDVSKTEAPTSREGPTLPSFENMGSIRETFSGVSSKSLGVILGILVVVAGAWWLMNQAPESLEVVAKETAQKFAEDDLAYLKTIASSDTVDDVVRWFDTVHPQLVKSREQWKTKQASVQVTVIDEDRRTRRGEAQAFVMPNTGPAHAASIAKEAEATAPQEPMTLKLHWVLNGTHWRLNGQQTLQAANQIQ